MHNFTLFLMIQNAPGYELFYHTIYPYWHSFNLTEALITNEDLDDVRGMIAEWLYLRGISKDTWIYTVIIYGDL